MRRKVGILIIIFIDQHPSAVQNISSEIIKEEIKEQIDNTNLNQVDNQSQVSYSFIQ